MTMTDKVLAGRYRLVELIGEGGMAYVYRAIDQKTEHSVAIKVMKSELGKDADYVSRFQREAEAASKMTHHNIVNLVSFNFYNSSAESFTIYNDYRLFSFYHFHVFLHLRRSF